MKKYLLLALIALVAAACSTPKESYNPADYHSPKFYYSQENTGSESIEKSYYPPSSTNSESESSKLDYYSSSSKNSGSESLGKDYTHSSYKPATTNSESSGRTYTLYTGPLGGKYYYNSNGNKVYVKHATGSTYRTKSTRSKSSISASYSSKKSSYRSKKSYHRSSKGYYSSSKRRRR